MDMDHFSFPDHHSDVQRAFTRELTHPVSGNPAGRITRTLVSPGYNVHGPPFHMFGLNVGAPVPMLRQYQQDQRLALFRPGDVIFSPTGAPLVSAHPATTDALYVHLSAEFLATIAEEMGLPFTQLELRPDLGTPHPRLARIGADLLHEVSQPGLGEDLSIEALLTQLSVQLVRLYAVGVPPALPIAPPQRPDLRRAVEYIHAALHTPITVRDLAALVHLSPFHFSRVFKQQYGLAPHQYILRTRVERAVELLRQPHATVGLVAREVGFANASHFIRQFKRLTGTTPHAHR